MFNLLPESLKGKIKAEYSLRRGIVILVLVIFAEATFMVFLFPSWIVSVYRDKDLSLQANSMGQSSFNTNVNKVVSDVSSINKRLVILSTTLEYPKIVPFINTILSKRTRSIYINQLVYTATSGTEAILTIDGISSTRESLVSFVKSLEDTKSFTKVNLPISNIAKEKNISFFVSLTIAP